LPNLHPSENENFWLYVAGFVIIGILLLWLSFFYFALYVWFRG